MQAGLDGISQQDVAFQADLTLPQATTGGGTWVSLGTRSVGGTRYNAEVYFAPDGTVELSFVSVVNWAETWLAGITLPDKYTPGTTLTVRFEVSGTGSTTLKAKAWKAGTTEPVAWQVQKIDSSAALQRAGALLVDVYTSASATRTSVVRVDNVWAGAAGTAPPKP
jgi:hypothetical protein